jgi:hypothetical protein
VNTAVKLFLHEKPEKKQRDFVPRHAEMKAVISFLIVSYAVKLPADKGV